MYILQFILIVFFAGAAFVAFIIWRAWRKIHKTVNEFNQKFSGGTQSQQGEPQQRTTTTDSGETIIDTRSQKQANQKIFSKDEGEYVDFEVKE